MQSRVLRRLAVTAVLVCGAGAAVVSTAEARPSRPSPRVTRGGFNLFQGAVNVLVNVNRVQCNITNFGNICVDPNGSPVIGGGFWPKGSPDQYVFGSGLQVGAVVQSATPFAWTGDTVGVYFEDPYGDQTQGAPITNVYSSLNASDVAAWPSEAYIQDTSLYNTALIGRPTISQQDTWVRYWDGNTSLTTGRSHTMGVLVEQRGLAWNFPSGNQDIVYFLFRFINITAASTSGAYDALAEAGYTSAQIADIGTIADDFRARAQSAYNVSIPAAGYNFHNMYASFFEDADEGQAGFNYSTAILPFAQVNVVKADFDEPQWSFPPNIFASPFAAAPGFEGTKYLKSPLDPSTADATHPKGTREFGITVWGNTSNGNPFPDARGTSQMYRYISGTVSTALGDPACNRNPTTQHTCNAIQQAVDTRFFESSGPFDMAPGQSAVIVVALVHAAPVAQLPGSGSGIYALQPFSLAPYITPGVNTMPIGFPATAESLAVYGSTSPGGVAYVRPIERAAGWESFSDANGNGIIEQEEVNAVPRSLLDKEKVAQAVFNNKFLLPFAPEAPLFFVVAGDNKVTIAWQKSTSEADGDPYFEVASAPLNPDLSVNALYDPNYRKFDVEGYRIWRGRSEDQMQVIAQFDYSGTQMIDYTGQFYNPTYGNQCAPELAVTASCPVAFPYPYAPGGPSNPIDLVGDVVQIPPGGRVKLADGNIFIIQADTAVTGGNTGFPRLTDNGVPFAYVDNGALNGFRYFYAVTAFDINSVASGPSSLESPLVTKTVTPRATSTNAQAAVLVTGLYGDDNVQLNPQSPFPTIDPANGTFTGIIPPTNSLAFGFLASVAEALPPGDITARIDSVTPGFIGGIPVTGTTPYAYVSLMSATDTVQRTVNLPIPSFSSDPTVRDSVSVSYPLVSYDSTRSRLLGLAFTQDARMPVKFSAYVMALASMATGQSMINGRYGVPGTAAATASQYLNLPRWYDEGGSEPAQPTINPYGSQSHTAGQLTGVDIIYIPSPYRQVIGTSTASNQINVNFRGMQYSMGEAWSAADLVVTWNADSSITVRDSTHHVFLPFKQSIEPGWGFVNERTFAPSGIAAGDLDDGTGAVQLDVVGYHHLYGINPVCQPDWWEISCTELEQKAEYEQIDYTNDGAPDGSGIALVIDGVPFIMKMASIPAAGTQWHLKMIGGVGMNATCSPGLPTSLAAANAITGCSGYTYTPPDYRSGWVPGVSVKLRVTQAFDIAANSGDLSNVHTVPDPYYVTNSLEITANTKVLRFVNLPARAIIRIYSASGILVNILEHNDPSGGGEQVWNLRNRNNQFVASGVYFYHVEGPDGKKKIGRFTVVNYAQ
jgi:hypothetical protein